MEWPCKCDRKNPEFSCLRLSFCASERKQVQMYPATINVTMQVTAELRNRSDFVQKVPVLSLYRWPSIRLLLFFMEIGHLLEKRRRKPQLHKLPARECTYIYLHFTTFVGQFLLSYASPSDFLLLFFIAGWLFLLHHLFSFLLFSHTNLPSWLEQAPQNCLNQASDFSCVQPQVVSAALRSRNKIVFIQLSTSLRPLKLSALRMARTQICTTLERGYKSGEIQHSIWNKCEFYSAQLDITDCKGNHVQSLFKSLLKIGQNTLF